LGLGTEDTRNEPDVVALDIGMPNLNGLDAAREILSDNPRAKILFLTIYDTEQAVKTAVQWCEGADP